jgi:salicylate hydroxylase
MIAQEQLINGRVQPASLPILIVGGGIGGLAAALALARKGVRTHVFEQAPQFGEIGAGIQLGPNVFRMLERLGLESAIHERAVFVDALIMMDALTEQEITRVPVDEGFRRRFGKPYAVIHRADLHAVLLEACRNMNEVTLETSRKITDIAEDDDIVTITTADGADYRGRALIGADGLWSCIRRHVVGDDAPIVSGHIAYRAVLPIEEMPERIRWNAATLWAGPKNHLVHYPLRGWKLFNLVAVFHSDTYNEGWNTEGNRDELMHRFEGVGPTVRGLLEKIETWRMWVLCDREPIENWSRGAVTLLGDAAHPMLQYFAQGACMAIEDAVCLADRLSVSGNDPSAAFRGYQEERYLRTGRVQLTARFLGQVYHAAGVERLLRNQMLAGRTPEKAWEGLAWLYGGP